MKTIFILLLLQSIVVISVLSYPIPAIQVAGDDAIPAILLGALIGIGTSVSFMFMQMGVNLILARNVINHTFRKLGNYEIQKMAIEKLKDRDTALNEIASQAEKGKKKGKGKDEVVNMVENGLNVEDAALIKMVGL